ncbi:TBC1 domain family member 14-like [Bacillus rossius redtenbacheri]|uniref:TBC1 domain family member 14-like n=1 Tax=Bacillus rossius redtenbacheri TaxID=93214 RepID=UPI002FDD1439
MKTESPEGISKASVQYVSNESDTESSQLVQETNLGLICCNSDLANSFQRMKDTGGVMGHTSRYLHKVFGNVNHNSRSRSLPSSLDNKQPPANGCDADPAHRMDVSDDVKCACSVASDGTSVHPQEVQVSNSHCKQLCDSWFRTWPERGSDKVVAGKSKSVLNSKISCNTQPRCSCPVSVGENSEVESPLGLNSIPENPSKCLVCRHGINAPANSCQNTCVEHKMDLPVSLDKAVDSLSLESDQFDSSNMSVSLSEVLQNIPLAYSPVTKQLHILTKDSSSKQEPLSQNNCYAAKQLESIEEEKCSRSSTKQREDSGIVVGNYCDDSISYESPHSTLQRVGTYATSLSRTDASSFSSIVSSLSDTSPSVSAENTTGPHVDPDSLSMNHSGTDSLGSYGEGNCFFEESGVKPKRRGLSGFFARNVFAWKSKGEVQSSGGPGWRLFGKTMCKPVDESDPGGSLPASPASVRSDGSGKRHEGVVASSSALIQHARPPSLPAKSRDEQLRHQQEYQGMVEAARKKELKEAKHRKKQLQQQLRFEEKLANAARVWNNEILPKWDHMKSSKKALELWWNGIPPSVRGKVWKLAIGNDLNITHQLYDICVARAQERLKAAEYGSKVKSFGSDGNSSTKLEEMDKEASVELIQLDISRTFPNLCIFQKGGPYYDILHSLLGAYVCYRPDVGYVQGMSFVAAVLILNMEAADAFVCFTNLLNQPCLMAFFRLNQPMMHAYYHTYNDFFHENLPRLFAHFRESALSEDLYLLDWMYTVFAKAMPLDVACRVWDVFLRDGEEFLFKTALGVLHLHQEALMKMDFIHGAQFLTRLPDGLAADELFRSIETIKMNVGKRTFSEVLAHHAGQGEHVS